MNAPLTRDLPFLVLTLVTLSGCFDPTHVSGTDTSADADPGTIRISVRLRNVTESSIVAVRVGDDPWTAPPAGPDRNTVDLNVPIGTYSVAFGCNTSFRHVSVFEFHTSDLREWEYEFACPPTDSGTLQGAYSLTGAESFVDVLQIWQCGSFGWGDSVFLFVAFGDPRYRGSSTNPRCNDDARVCCWSGDQRRTQFYSCSQSNART